ncbi:hypothetical protein EIP91_000999 [Steccherinum ochraceum]|uniref:Transcription factor domain-containing protein n=1 Tax=Steccherinum ochraceum TaxID=92696 RepID=A0A4R0RH63_9APHY|nr:hypothetical protein EIP91_000999 [Steccherinum ochraceum]
MASCIAALAVRHTTLPEIKQHGVSAAVEAYSTNAVTILASIAYAPSIDNLHTLILLSWIEFKRNRSGAFCAYAEMAVQMAMDLGLSNDKFALTARNEHERRMLQATWTSISQLNTTSNTIIAIQHPHSLSSVVISRNVAIRFLAPERLLTGHS